MTTSLAPAAALALLLAAALHARAADDAPAPPTAPAAALPQALAAFPHETVSGPHLALSVMLPDAEKGYYRAARFDPSGLIARAAFAGRTVFGPFRDPPDPANNDNVVGPADEFDMDSPPGFADAPVGGEFVKIAVGVLRKAAEKYVFHKPQIVVERPPWTVTRGPGWIAFRQDLRHGPWGYAYTKRITLDAGGPGFVLAHTLANTGEWTIDTTVYNHNFILLDDRPVGPAYRVTFPFEVRPRGAKGPVEFRGHDLVIAEPLKGSIWTALAGSSPAADENRVTVAHRETGTAVVITGDRPLVEWRFYAEKTAACPEPFIRIMVEPGKSESWQTHYAFEAGKP
jgi:hypothetical protein